jgi:hypothetical protein
MGRPPAETEPQGCQPGLAFSESGTASPPGACKGGEGVGTRITLFVIFHWAFLEALYSR